MFLCKSCYVKFLNFFNLFLFFAVASETVTLRPNSFPNDDMASRRQKVALNRQSSRQSVKSLIESIENAGKPVVVKTGKKIDYYRCFERYLF